MKKQNKQKANKQKNPMHDYSFPISAERIYLKYAIVEGYTCECALCNSGYVTGYDTCQ